MDIEKLKIKVLNLEENTNLKEFNNLIKLCVDNNEMGAVVYLYDKKTVSTDDMDTKLVTRKIFGKL